MVYEEKKLSWQDEDKTFIETHNFPAMLEKVRNQPFVTFVGVPGSGKSATVHHIALILQKEGYDILPIRDISDIETFCDPQNPQVFVIDDVLGVFGLDLAKFKMLNEFQDKLVKPMMSKTKILMTCREVVFRDEDLSNTFLSKKGHVVQLHSDENALTVQDKYDLLTKYNLDAKSLSSNNLSEISNMFPLLCKLFATKKEYSVYGPNFFISPVPCILKLLDKMKMKTGNKIQYASLVLLMANNGKLSKEILDNKCIDKFVFLRACKVEAHTDSFIFIDALTEMEGTYTKKCRNDFSFIHDSMFEIVAWHFGNQCPELILQYMSSDYIAHYIKVNTYKSKENEKESQGEKKTGEGNTCSGAMAKPAIDLCLQLSNSHYEVYAERLFRDIQNGELHNVFKNKSLKYPPVLQALLDVMAKKSYEQLYSVFLTDLREKNRTSKYEQGNEHGRNERYIPENFLLFDYRTHYRVTLSSRAISWVIYYGHYKILQYLIDEMIKKSGNVNNLFKTFHNKRQQSFIDHGQSCTVTDVKKTPDSYRGKSNEAADCDDDNHMAEIVGNYDKAASDTESDLDIDIVSEPVTVEQFRLLCLGCYSGDLNTVKILLNYVCKKCVINEDPSIEVRSMSPLLIACTFGYSDIAMALLKAGANVNLNSHSWTPLTASSSNGQLSVVKVLIKAKADVNLQNGNKTPLTAACDSGHLSVVVELIKAGADVNLELGDKAPLIAASEKGHVLVVEELIKAGADNNIRYKNRTPLTAACSAGHLDIARELIRAGADINLNDGSKSPLTAAYDFGHSNIVEELLKVVTLMIMYRMKIKTHY